MTTKYQITDGPQPFVQLIERFGGYGLISGSADGGTPFGDIWVQLWCIAPDEKTAIKIEESKPPFTDHDKVLSTVRRTGTAIYLGWEWREGGWSLIELINELQELGCTDLTYHFTGTVYSETPKYRIQSKDSDDSL